jgi:hypothetical protein
MEQGSGGHVLDVQAGNMARLTPEQWQQARIAWESVPNASYESVGAQFGTSKQSVWKRATSQGWKKSTSTPAINDFANRRADAMVDPTMRGKSDEVDEKLDASPPFGIKSERVTDPASDEESIRKKATIIATHRDDASQLGVILRAARNTFVAAVQLQGSNDDKKAAWWRAKTAQSATRDAIAGAAMRHEMERRAWGLDVVVDPVQIRNMSDADLELLASGKAPRGLR